MTITFRQQIWIFEVNLGIIWSNEYNIKTYLKLFFELSRFVPHWGTSAWAHALVPQWVLPHWGIVWHHLYREMGCVQFVVALFIGYSRKRHLMKKSTCLLRLLDGNPTKCSTSLSSFSKMKIPTYIIILYSEVNILYSFIKSQVTYRTYN